nr:MULTISPECIES: putative colanic acid biosynthesis acetyltransferase [unclassified Rhodococcus (in: high G+C Gram-positive bacteria)]
MGSGTHPNLSLAGFTGHGYDKGRNVATQILWQIASAIIQQWWFPSGARVAVLRLFGASIGKNVLIRHRVRIHWPWKLVVGDSCWVGEGAWLLNLEKITIGTNVCISQDALLCTGSHLRSSATFEFDNGAISIGDAAWICCRAIVLRGVTVGSHAIVGAGSIAHRDLNDYSMLEAPKSVERKNA